MEWRSFQSSPAGKLSADIVQEGYSTGDSSAKAKIGDDGANGTGCSLFSIKGSGTWVEDTLYTWMSHTLRLTVPKVLVPKQSVMRGAVLGLQGLCAWTTFCKWAQHPSS